MCGIAGVLASERDGVETLTAIAEQMGLALTHRGPDGHGVWREVGCGVAMSHRRLSIIDLSYHGSQPMVSHTGRYVMSFNGEIYNFRVLRSRLEALGCSFRGHSDTEVLLAGIEKWGLPAALRECVGMFALALWDRNARTIHLARDRLGEKPLYYGWAGRAFVFASELRAISRVPGFRADIDRGALCLFLRHGYVPAPHCIFRGLHKLLPGTTLSLRYEEIFGGEPPELVSRAIRYWDPEEQANVTAQRALDGNPSDAIRRLEEVLLNAVSQCVVADVPVGAFLSGGIDSSLVTALMQRCTERRVRTFSIGFHEDRFNEAPYAKAVAAHIGTDHTEHYVSEDDALRIVPMLPQIYDEPFADSSQIPTFLVSKLAREHVTVALSGDGGDELFAGYGRYQRVSSIAARILPLPKLSRRLLSGTIRAAQTLGPIDGRAAKVGRYLAADTLEELYLNAVSYWHAPARAVLHAREPESAFPSIQDAIGDYTRRMCLIDLVTYLPDDILVKVDRASMAVSLETRCPLLDHRVVEYALQVPMALKVQDGKGKWLLRQLLSRYVPHELVERPKMGFGVPLAKWLQGALREWAEELLDPHDLRNGGIFDVGTIRGEWARLSTAPDAVTNRMWNVLTFLAWQREGSASRPGLPAPAANRITAPALH